VDCIHSSICIWWRPESFHILPFNLMQVLVLRLISRAKSGACNELFIRSKYPISKGITNIVSQTNPVSQEFLRVRESWFVGIQIEDRLVEVELK
jgi:hypothetical protein